MPLNVLPLSTSAKTIAAQTKDTSTPRIVTRCELLLLSVNINFVAFSRQLGDPAGQVFVFFILTVAAAEAAIGLAILVTLFRNRRTIDVADIDLLKG